METVAAVVVTFNRLTDLQRCIDSLRRQSYPLTSLVVFDNGSTDGTAAWLARQPDVSTILNKENLGGAGGFHHALKHAYAQHFDWFWLMDDDCSPAPDCLEQLLSIDHKDTYAGLAPTVYEDDKIPATHRANLTYAPNLDTVQSPLTYGESEAAIAEIDYASFVGLLLPYRSVATIGLPRSDFFIHYDDVEYSLRLKRQVGKIALLHAARIDHHQAAKPSVTAYPIDKLWIRFYGIRNSIWLKREPWADLKPLHKLRLTGSFVKTLSRQWLHVLLHDDHKVKRLKFYTAAYLDGWFGVFDNEKPRNILKTNSTRK